MDSSYRRTTADRLLGQIYLWIFKAQQCALILKEQVKELENVPKENADLSTGQKIGLALLAIPYGPLWGPILYASVNKWCSGTSASSVTRELEKDKMKYLKCNKIREKIQQLNKQLRTECLTKNSEDVDRFVLLELMKSLAKSEGLNYSLCSDVIERLINNDLKCGKSNVFQDAITYLVGLLQFFDINVSIATSQIAVKDSLVHELDSSLPVAIDNVKKNDYATAIKILGDISGHILQTTRKLLETAYEAQSSLGEAVQSQNGQSEGHREQPEYGDSRGAGTGSGAGAPGGGGGGGRRHENEDDEEDSSDDESSDEDERGRKRKKLRMALLNVRSVNKNSVHEGNLIRNLILNNNLDFFLITETWLKPGPGGDNTLRRLLPPNHNFIHEPREHWRGGGVAIVFSNQFQCRKVPLTSYTPCTFECVAGAVSHETWDSPILVVAVYHPPGPNYNEFIDFAADFVHFLDVMSSDFSHIIVAGDFNIWIDDMKKRSGRDFCEILSDNHLDQFVTVTTHQKGHTLDLVVGRKMNVTDVRVNDDNISDHWTVYFVARPKKKDDHVHDKL